MLTGSELELRFYELFERAHAELLEAPDLALCELLVTNVDERRTTPQADRSLVQASLLVDESTRGPCEQSLEA